jgi:hypothetical protein
MLVDEQLKDLNGEWDDFLQADPYVKVAYDVMLLMIK